MFIVSAKNQVTVTASHSLYSFFSEFWLFFRILEKKKKKRNVPIFLKKKISVALIHFRTQTAL